MAKNVDLFPNNNMNITFDETNEKKRMDEILRRASTDALDVQTVMRAKLKSNFSHLCIIPLFDLHMFGDGYCYDRVKNVLKYLKNLSNGYAFIGGDWFDNANVMSKTNSYNSRTNISQALDGGRVILEEVKDKIMFVLGGNHDGEFGDRVKPANISPAKEASKSIAKYVPFNILLNIELPNKMSFNTFITHGSLGKSFEDIKDKSIRVSQEKTGITPDLVLAGDKHQALTCIVKCSEPSKNFKGLVTGVKNKNVRIDILPSFQGDNEYSASKGFTGGGTNAYAYDLSFEKNPHYSSKTKDLENEYILKIVRFPLLKKNTNDFTFFAKKYLEAYLEPNREYIEKMVIEEMQKDNIQYSIDNIAQILNEITKEMNNG